MTARIIDRETVYSGWLSLARLTVEMPNGAIEERHIEDHGAAVALLPYDPERRTAILLTQPRMPVLDAGEPPLLEVVAGRLDMDDPEAMARHEAREEAGLELGPLEFVVRIWSMPTISTERIHFLAPYAAADRVGPGGGSILENECIDVHEMALDRLWAEATEGRIADAKTLLLVQALRLRHPELFAA